MPDDPRRLPHHPGLDGLRGLAVAAVLAYHGGFAWAKGGYLGVSVFFTLSGFLITSLLLAEHQREGSISLRRFWGRRFRRLLPAAVVALAGVAVFALTVASADQRRTIDGDILAALAYVANWRFVLEDVAYGEFFADPSPVLHFWSLAIEEQFYVLFPPLVAAVLAVSRRRLAPLAAILVALVAASVAMSFVLEGAGPDRIYFGTDTRAVEILVGALLAVAVAAWGRPSSRIAGLATSAGGIVALGALGFAAATVAQSSDWLYRGGFAGIALVSATAVFASARESRLGSVLGNPALRWLGLRSYGLYLYHWPIFQWLDAGLTGLEPWPLFAVRVAVTATIAEASYHLVEMPFREGRIPRLQARILAPVATAGVAAAAVALAATAPPPALEFEEEGVIAAAAPEVLIEEDEHVVVLGGPLAGQLAAALDAAVDPGEALVVDDESTAACVPDCPTLEAAWSDAVAEAATVVFLVGPSDPLAGDVEALRRIREAVPPDARVLWVTHPIAGSTVEPTPTPAPELVGSHDATNAIVGETAAAVGDEVIDLARLVEPPAVGTPPVRVTAAVALDDPVLLDRLDQVVAQILEGSRSAPQTLRILVIGDSVSGTLADGLVAWGQETGSAVVWNATRPGCGILREGELLGVGFQSEGCRSWAQYYPEHIRDFAPDLVVVHSGPWDLIKRRLPGSEEWTGPGDPEFDAYMRDEYAEAISVLGAGGAPVLWLGTPCFTPDLPNVTDPWLGPERRSVQSAILADLVAEGLDLRWFDLEALACPGGAYSKDIAGIVDARPDGVHFSLEAATWIAREHLAPVISDATGAPVGSTSVNAG